MNIDFSYCPMKVFVLGILILFLPRIHGQCEGGIWSIENTTIGSFTVSWRYNNASNKVQFLLEGQAAANINLTSTYLAIGWSDVISTNITDVAMSFLGAEIIQDRYSVDDALPSIDTEQDLCLMQSNIIDRNISISFERNVTTGDVYDLDFTSNVSLMFSMGVYNMPNDGETFDLQTDFFRQSLDTNVSLVRCLSAICESNTCSNTSCYCLQEVPTNIGRCVCFPSSPCMSEPAENDAVSAVINGSCQNQSNPCSSNGICLQTSPTQFICQCQPEYTGVLCQISLFSMDLAFFNTCRCLNGGSCLDNDTCLCSNGYVGAQCQTINSCLSNPCNLGTCVISSTCSNQTCDYSCLCPNGTIGTKCEIEINPCSSNPCRNNGTCSTSSNNYSCQCIPPYNGTNCETMINVCTSNPCLNNGKCVQDWSTQNGSYRCECSMGYLGARCEHVNACLSSPCQNGGQCSLSSTNCSSTTCSFSCQCPSNATGDRCETIRATCTNSTCSNYGVCSIENSTTRCTCAEGFTGRACEISISSCSPNPCGFNGTCVQTSNSSYYCICSNGLTGQSCKPSTLGSCTSSPCRHLSTCQEIENSDPPSYRCVCPDYLTGDRCQYTNTCRKQPCLNRGRCVPLGPQNNFMCLCSPGFGHYDCSIYLGLSCNANVCLNGGTCDRNTTRIQCLCPAGFAGPRCEWTSVCSLNTCQNGGTCRQTGPTMAECICQTGFTGPTCSLRDSCATLPCKNGGGCTTLLADTGTNWSAYRCVCPSGIYGQHCDSKISSCLTMVCPTYKICSEQPTGPVCICAGDKMGPLCQYDNPCRSSSSHCHNGSTCVALNTDPPNSSCLCREGFTGKQCDILMEDNPCASNPCQTRGYCALSSSNKTYTCVCQENFIGEQCERNNPCLSSPCLNQGLCQANWNRADTWFTCRCIGTFTGNRCETSLLNPCGGLCMNGSPCNDGVCVCPAQYTGNFCGFDNPCYKSICRNGGTCSVISNTTNVSFACTCPNSFTGEFCEVSLQKQMNDSCAPECTNGGSCVNGMCMCTSQYIGPTCQYENPCDHQNPCLNNGTCFGRYSANETLSTDCLCPPGFTGNHCEVTLCSPTSCNGGVCQSTQDGIICICPTGKFGDRCQYNDACAINPCLPTERCEQIGGLYQCISCYDKSSYCSIYQLRNEYCDNRYTILVDDNFLPVPQACQRSCGQCIPVQRLKDISPLFANSSSFEKNKISSIPPIVSSSERNKCLDRRDDCSMQKAYGFCSIFNEKYPDDCVKTCHPDCTHLS